MHQVDQETLVLLVREQQRQIEQISGAVQALGTSVSMLLALVERLRARMMLYEAGEALTQLDERRTVN